MSKSSSLQVIFIANFGDQLWLWKLSWFDWPVVLCLCLSIDLRLEMKNFAIQYYYISDDDYCQSKQIKELSLFDFCLNFRFTFLYFEYGNRWWFCCIRVYTDIHRINVCVLTLLNLVTHTRQHHLYDRIVKCMSYIHSAKNNCSMVYYWWCRKKDVLFFFSSTQHAFVIIITLFLHFFCSILYLNLKFSS